VRGWGTVSQTGLCPGGDVDSWTIEVDKCSGGSGGSGSVTIGTSGMTEAS
jgi:hypothetical protein